MVAAGSTAQRSSLCYGLLSAIARQVFFVVVVYSGGRWLVFSEIASYIQLGHEKERDVIPSNMLRETIYSRFRWSLLTV